MKHFLVILFAVLAAGLMVGCKTDKNLELFYGVWKTVNPNTGGGAITFSPQSITWENGDFAEYKVIKKYPRSVYLMTKHTFAHDKSTRYFFVNYSIEKGEESWNKDSVYFVDSGCSPYGLEDEEHYNMSANQFWAAIVKHQQERKRCLTDEKGFPIRNAGWSTTGYLRPLSDFKNPEVFK